MKETDPRFVNLDKKAGLFFIIAAVGIIATFMLIGIERGTFTPKYRIHFTVANGTGFFEGMAVKLSGFKIGKIGVISLDDDAKVKVTLLINKKYQKWIREDSIAVFTKEGLIGENIVEILVGTSDKPVLKDGATIRYEKTSGLDDIIEEAKPMIVDIRNIISYINDPNGDIKQTLANLKILSIELLITRSKVDKFIKNTDDNVTAVKGDALKTIKNIDSAVADIDRTILGIEKNISPVMDKLNKTMDSAEKAVTGIKDAVEQSAPKVPELINKGENALENADEVVKSLKQVWPIRSFIEEKKGNIRYGDSYE